MLNKLCLLCVVFLNFYFVLYILLVFLTGSCKFGGIYFCCLLLYYRVCYCIDLFSPIIMLLRYYKCSCRSPTMVVHFNEIGWFDSILFNTLVMSTFSKQLSNHANENMFIDKRWPHSLNFKHVHYKKNDICLRTPFSYRH